MQKSPHLVIETYISHFFPNAQILGKSTELFINNKKNISKLRRLYLNSLDQFRYFYNVVKARETQIAFREFSSFDIIWFFFPFRRDLIFVINHNLNTFHGRIVSRILSYRFQVVMADPGAVTQNHFPYIKPLFTDEIFSFNRSAKWDLKSVIVMTGSKRDQRNWKSSEINRLIFDLREFGFDVLVLGSNFHDSDFVPQELFDLKLSHSAVICLTAYIIHRNAGTIWELKQKAPVILFNGSECAEVQLIGHPSAFMISDGSHAVSILTEQIGESSVDS